MGVSGCESQRRPVASADSFPVSRGFGTASGCASEEGTTSTRGVTTTAATPATYQVPATTTPTTEAAVATTGAKAPYARMGAMVWEPAGQRAILYGGESSGRAFVDTWAYDPKANSWTELQPGGSLPALTADALVYDPARAKTILFGRGIGSDSLSSYASVTIPSPNVWTKADTAGGAPPSAGWIPRSTSPPATRSSCSAVQTGLSAP